jgi:hypothetical protein
LPTLLANNGTALVAADLLGVAADVVETAK